MVLFLLAQDFIEGISPLNTFRMSLLPMFSKETIVDRRLS